MEMESIFHRIWQGAKPYLDTRRNDIHVEISIEMAEKLLKKAGGDWEVVIPAIILHDIGYKKIPEDQQKKAFGKVIRSPELQRLHEVEGAKIAKEILDNLDYNSDKTREIIKIIDGHDSREKAISLNDRIVKDADKLYRYSRTGFQFFAKIGFEEFGETPVERLKRYRSIIDSMLFTREAKEIARKEIEERFLELEEQL